MKLVTIGVYGFAKDEFFAALKRAGVDTFCDIRWRRAVRGSDYSFVNSKRLQKSLGEVGVRYLHLRDLAPRPELRQRQYQEDESAGIAKRKRTQLGEAFKTGYCAENLENFNAKNFIERWVSRKMAEASV